MKRQNQNGKKSGASIYIAENGLQNELTNIDLRKYELIEYYAKSKGMEKDLPSLSELLQRAFDDAMEKEYKKYVPQTVRAVYDKLMSRSEAFGAIIAPETQATNDDKAE